MTLHPTPDTTRHAARLPLHALAERVSGRLHTPDDEDWGATIVPWRVNIAQRPLAVLDAHDAHDVVAAVKWAVLHEVPVTTQTTGHGATAVDGVSPADGALVVRCTGLTDIEVDLERRTAWVGAGVRAGQLLAALEGTGHTFLCGSNPSPSVVGMTVTGGLSWFGRAFGAGADSIRTVELVDGLGRLRRIGPDDAERFWAVRGAGGDFGVITRMEIALHPAPEVYGGRLVWPVEQLPEVLAAFRTVTATAPRELTVWLQVQHFPDVPFLPEEIRGQSFAAVAFTFLGAEATAQARMAPLAAVPGRLLSTAGPLPISELGDVAAEPVDPTPALEYAQLLHSLDDATVAGLVEQVGTRGGTPITITQVRHLGGALREGGTSAFGTIEEEYLLQGIGVPAVPELVPAIEGAFAGLDSAAATVGSGRAPLAFLAETPTVRWWGAETRARLVAAKQDLDPLGIVRSNRPVSG
jgi:FAD/FMN-containing dehydrogenase